MNDRFYNSEAKIVQDRRSHFAFERPPSGKTWRLRNKHNPDLHLNKLPARSDAWDLEGERWESLFSFVVGSKTICCRNGQWTMDTLRTFHVRTSCHYFNQVACNVTIQKLRNKHMFFVSSRFLKFLPKCGNVFSFILCNWAAQSLSHHLTCLFWRSPDLRWLDFRIVLNYHAFRNPRLIARKFYRFMWKQAICPALVPCCLYSTKDDVIRSFPPSVEVYHLDASKII